MGYMSRAGRKELMLRTVIEHDKRYPKGYLPVAKIAHKAGLKSSTEVRKMLYELVEDGLLIDWQVEPYYGCGYCVLAFALARYESSPMFENDLILINGELCNREGEVVESVAL